MNEPRAHNHRETELDRQLAQWRRPPSVKAWNRELQALEQLPVPSLEPQGWMMLLSGLLAGWVIWSIFAWMANGWLGLGLDLVALWAGWKIWKGYQAAQAWVNAPRQVRVHLLQEYPTDSLAFRWECQDHPALSAAYRALRQTKVPILQGDVAHLRQRHGIVHRDGDALIVLFFGGLLIALALGFVLAMSVR